MKSADEGKKQFLERLSKADSLTRMLRLFGAHAAPPAARFGRSGGHRGQQWVSDANRGEGIVHQDVFQLGAHLRGDAIGWAALGHSPKVVGEGYGAVCEIEGCCTSQVRLVLQKFLAAVLKNWFLFDDPIHQIRRAEASGRD